MFKRHREVLHLTRGHPFSMGYRLEPSLALLHESDNPVRPPATVPDPPPMEEILPWKAVCLSLSSARHNPLNDLSGLLRDTLVSIDDQDPFMAAFRNSAVFLRAVTFPVLDEDPAPESTGY